MSAALPSAAPRRSPEVAIAVSTLGSQVCVYLLSIVSTRALGPAVYGELASLLTITVIMSIPGMALQSWAARTTALRHDSRSVLATTSRLAAVAFVATVAVTLLLAPYIDVDPVPSAISAALLVFPLVWLYSAQGFLQGENRMVALAAVVFLSGVARLVGGVVGIELDVGAWAVVWGIGLATVAVAGGAWVAVLQTNDVRRHQRSWAPLVRIAAATGAMWVLANIDVLLARLVLSPHAAGQYAAGALVTRAVQFAPQFVILSTFAGLTDPDRTRAVLRQASIKVVVIGAGATAFLLAVGGRLVPLVLGAGFDEAGRLSWLFALLGTLLALNQLLVAQRVARVDESIAIGVWAAAAVLCGVVIAWPGPTTATVLVAGIVVNVVLAAGLTLRTLARR